MSMQHSARQAPHDTDAPEPGRALPRQERSAPPRRSRHTAETASAASDPASMVVPIPARSRRSRREEPSKLFSLEEPPPLDAPLGITEIMGWSLAAAMWRDHLPEQLLGIDCASCDQAWPCDTWKIADDLLTECCEAAGEAAVKAR
ncbi:hypothetical protein [Glycomyces algeriensis]|uniref:Uncharacterized protein n=1 Tax=Glycomyces algeriensis TaxID=256037 RepID=A0A9W6G6H9_9ACTN|nr:hypothetical protein [Glycomyces algeriensis]MDA1366356.1 hypothetical protein [Glycomyces algeriensis]MDR7348704.1 hypothetical protein [Glycomyces algeriensis]GLI41406.1 hypothetical protein GALLR39Z86_12560 [Glycomyces algeriensis]